MQEPSKPDLDESVNVTSSHQRVLSDVAAVAREKRVDEGGMEPVSLWIFATCAFVCIFAGLALGSAGGFFDYEQTVKPGYVRKALDSGEDTGPKPTPAIDAYMAKGQKVYGKCIGCHGPDGKGGGAFPSLAGSDWVIGDTQLFAMIVLNGLSGPTSTGKTYGVMPAQGIGMSEADLAAVMTYVRNSFGNETGDVISKEMAASAFEIAGQRENPEAPMEKQALESKYMEPLPGDPVDPQQMVDPVSLAPVEEET